MEKQNLIKQVLTAGIDAVRAFLRSKSNKNRAEAGRAVCREFGFVDARGKEQTAGCVKALKELEAKGLLELPATGSRNPRKERSPRRLPVAVEEPKAVPSEAGEVRGLSLVKVSNLDQIRIWNEMMIREHPQGAGLQVGAQIRYLIGSEHGWLGGLGFSAAALALSSRDKWIGWDEEVRKAQLHRVVGMSRFLIRPQVRCRNLASRVLGMAVRTVGEDYEAQYGYRPWLLESFVDTEQFAGTCYRAANWVSVGETQGRGRQDREHKKAKSVKGIYVYPLESDWRARMGIVEPIGPAALEITEGLDGDEWANNEFGGASLGDQRLNERLVDCARSQGEMPGRAFCAVAQGDWAAIKGYYRMIDKPDDSEVTMEAILAPHRQRTVQRMKAQKTVLCIQDGTDLNYSRLVSCEGLGVIGTNQTAAQSNGLHLHSTFVATTEGLPLGVLGAQCTSPLPKVKEAGKPSAAVPIEEKKTFSWIVGLRECIALTPQLPDTRQVCVMDREADFFELFDEQRTGNHCVDLLVRAKHDRPTNGMLNLFDSVRQTPVQGQLLINVSRQSARAKKSKQKARPGRMARKADVFLRYQKIELRPPSDHKDKKPISLWVVHVRESSPAADAEPLEWFLLTTIEIATAEQAQECLRWYCLRWRIEDWHRVLKSGCRIEELQHKSADRLKRAIAINLVIAWRIMLMTLLGRACPELPSEVLFSDLELEVLTAYAKKKALKNPSALEMPSVS